MTVHHLPRAAILSLILVLSSALALCLSPLPSHPSGASASPFPRAGTEAEPNNDVQHATPLETGIVLAAYLAEVGDEVDWFHIWVPRGLAVNVTILVDKGTDLDADLELFYEDAWGASLVSWSRTQYRYETVCILSAMDQYYDIKVSAVSGMGGYTVGAFVEDVPVLTNGSKASGSVYIDAYNVVDYYKVWLEAWARGTADRVSVHMAKSEAIPGVWPGLDLEVQRIEGWGSTLSYYDLSWGHDGSEDVAATAMGTGWYYIKVYASNASGRYDLDVSISSVRTDGDGTPEEAPSIYGPDILLEGSLSQTDDHLDISTIYLIAGEGLTIEARLWMGTDTVLGITVTDKDLVPLGEWTNIENGALASYVEATIDGPAITQAGEHHIILTAKAAVEEWDPFVLSQEDGQVTYEVHARPTGHNTLPSPYPDHPSTLEMVEDTPFVLDAGALFSDTDITHGDRLSFQASSWNSSFIVMGPDVYGQATVTPPRDVCGEWTVGGKAGGAWGITVRALDRYKAAASLDLDLAVTCVNDAPDVLKDRTIELWMDEDDTRIGPSMKDVFTDTDLAYMDRLTFDVIGNGSLPVRMLQNGSMVLGPATGHPGDVYMTVTATDMGDLMASCVFVVHVMHVPHAPATSIQALDIVVPEDGTRVVDLGAIFSDVEDPHLLYTWTGNSDVRLVQRDIGLIEVSAPADWNGDEDITVKGTDSEGLFATMVLHVHFTTVPDPPSISNAHPKDRNVTLKDGGSVTFWISVDDPDRRGGSISGDTIHFSWSLDGHIVLPRAQGQDAYTLSSDGLATGEHVVEVLVSDSTGNKASWRWTIDMDRPAKATGRPVRVTPDTGAAAAAGASIGMWAIAVLFLSEHGRYAVLKLLLIPLYSKIRKEKVLDHFTRGRIFGFVESHPGCNYTQIKAYVGVGNGTLTHHLSTLEREGYVRSERDGLSRRFYPAGAPVVGDVIELSMVQREIYALVKIEPGISQAEVAKRLGVSRRVVNYHVKLLEGARLLRLERGPKKTYLHIIEPEAGAEAGQGGKLNDDGERDEDGDKADGTPIIGGGKEP